MIECLLDYPIESKYEAERKWNNAVRISGRQGLSCGLFDDSQGKWLSLCNNGNINYQMCSMLNRAGFGPKSGRSYNVVNIDLD